MTLTEQLQAEQRERAAALNEATRRQVDPNRFRTDADRARLAATDAARLAAEETLNAARLAKIAAENAVDDPGKRTAEASYGDTWSRTA